MRLVVEDQMSCAPVALRAEALLITPRIAVARGWKHRSHPHGVLRRRFGPLPKTSTGKLRKDSLHGQAKAVE